VTERIHSFSLLLPTLSLSSCLALFAAPILNRSYLKYFLSNCLISPFIKFEKHSLWNPSIHCVSTLLSFSVLPVWSYISWEELFAVDVHLEDLKKKKGLNTTITNRLVNHVELSFQDDESWNGKGQERHFVFCWRYETNFPDLGQGKTLHIRFWLWLTFRKKHQTREQVLDEAVCNCGV